MWLKLSSCTVTSITPQLPKRGGLEHKTRTNRWTALSLAKTKVSDILLESSRSGRCWTMHPKWLRIRTYSFCQILNGEIFTPSLNRQQYYMLFQEHSTLNQVTSAFHNSVQKAGFKRHSYQFHRFIVHFNVFLWKQNFINFESYTWKTQLSCYVHSSQLHIHSNYFHGTNTSKIKEQIKSML